MRKERSNLKKQHFARNILKGRSMFTLTAMLAIVVLGSFVWQYRFTLQAQALFVDLPPMTLTVVAPDGTRATLNETDVGNMPSYRAYGGYRNTLGVIKGLGNYTGIPINSLCDAVGGIRSGYSVSIIAVDGYTKKMSYEELNGALVTYDNVTGQEVQHNQTLTPILAYHYNDVNVSSADGPLRVAIVGPEGLCTSSTFWVKQVVRLEVHAILQPMNLTVVASNGAQVVLNETFIGNLASYRAYGGYRNQLGVLKGLGNYTGVPIKTFTDIVGGVQSGYSVSIIAVDGYTKKMSYEELNGALITYDNVTGEQVQHNQTLIPMLAYHYNDVNLTIGDGPLKTAIAGPEGLCTGSTYWVKQVVRLEVHPNLQPMNLTLVALNGTQIVLNETAIGLLSAVRAVGASRNQMGIVKNLGNYTGPSLNTLCNLVGGMSNSTTLRVTAADNYNVTLSYAEFNGDLTTYDNVTGQPVQHNQTLIPILAYHFNDANLSVSDGALKLGIIGPEGLATSAGYWVKNVVKLEILPVVMPITLALTVEPAIYHATSINETFSVSINIHNVTDTMKLVGFELRLGYNSTLLDVVQVTNGSFLETFAASPNGGMLYYGPYYETDYVLFAGFILPDSSGTWYRPFPNGNGTVATLTFRVKYQPVGLDQPNAACNLTLFDTKLADIAPTLLPHNTTNGYYDIAPTAMGDLNFDGKVDIFDALVLANAFGTTPSEPRWNVLADLNHDGTVDIFDAIILGNHFGEGTPNP